MAQQRTRPAKKAAAQKAPIIARSQRSTRVNVNVGGGIAGAVKAIVDGIVKVLLNGVMKIAYSIVGSLIPDTPKGGRKGGDSASWEAFKAEHPAIGAKSSKGGKK